MSSDEAPSLSEPRRYNRKYSIIYRIFMYLLFAVIIVLAVINLNIYSWYNQTKENYQDAFLRAENASYENSNLIAQNENLKTEYELLKNQYSKILNQNEEILEKIEQLKNKNKELESTNKELVEDNIELQNSLKTAASIGIKPQSYTSFEGISTRDTIEKGEYIGKFLGTFYTPSAVECGNDKGITRSGHPIIPGISIAIDKEYWPFGTIFYIKGLGYAVAMDTGSAIKGKYRFDFAVFDRNFANQLGKDYWDVYLVKLGDGNVNDISL
ncbi:3D domain-containing protein [Herbivorax sp. ANBcel31]|uniref:3D domain-containing protein n=1 Tax=Herbivorax sp. ANBcel31 TaxID=3069754 RepID=UPI0027ADF2CA|nr:3D domain-containing protein [Herbivorax sp. ANBcel31]MDQ2086179.1 3D domain-containing protein [Herbivorax sp. ANBcel31]